MSDVENKVESKQVENNNDVFEYKIKATTDVIKLSIAIYKGFMESKEQNKLFHLRAVGEESVNQCIKGIIRAKGLLSQNGINILMDPFWLNDIDKSTNGNINVIVFRIVESI